MLWATMAKHWAATGLIQVTPSPEAPDMLFAPLFYKTSAAPLPGCTNPSRRSHHPELDGRPFTQHLGTISYAEGTAAVPTVVRCPAAWRFLPNFESSTDVSIALPFRTSYHADHR